MEPRALRLHAASAEGGEGMPASSALGKWMEAKNAETSHALLDADLNASGSLWGIW